MAATLFESSEECLAFIVANPPQELEETLEGTPTLTQLRTTLFQSSLKDIQDSFTMTFDSKVAKAADNGNGNIMTVVANMRRLANKFTVSLNIREKSTVEEETEWISVPADAEVEFHNAFKEAALGGDFATVKAGDNDYKTQYFNTASIPFGEPVQDENNNDKWICTTERPVYTYSMTWDFTGGREPYLIIGLPWKNTTSGETHPTYYKVFFSTKELTTNNWCHLNVELDRLGSFFKEDPVQIFDDMTYQVLDWNDAYEEGHGISTEIDDARYLMMEQTEYWIYGQDSWNFPYTSSHDCEIVGETYEKSNYRHRNEDIISGPSSDLTDYTLTYDGSLITFNHPLNKDFNSTVVEGGIHYGAYDVVPYTFKFRIRHTDKPDDYFQDVTVHQYPAIYIEAQPNSAGVYLDPYADPLPKSTAFLNIHEALLKNASNPTDREHYFDPDRYEYYGYGDDPQKLLSPDNFGNANGNMYVITTTIAPVIDGESYLLADPRQHTNEVADLKKDYKCIWDPYVGGDGKTHHQCNFGDPYYPVDSEEESNNIFITAEALDGPDRTLQYYYPTKKSADVENVIAPKIRVASSWGQSEKLCYEKAVRRCAAYQEDGYPAGRWRLPTKAEVMYICKLSADHMIPMLFGDSNYDFDESFSYWCSTGKVDVYPVEKMIGNRIIPIDNPENPPVYNPGTEFKREHCVRDDPEGVSVRCVYDEWYWENRDYDNGTVATEKGRLPEGYWGERYWGDMPR